MQYDVTLRLLPLQYLSFAAFVLYEKLRKYGFHYILSTFCVRR